MATTQSPVSDTTESPVSRYRLHDQFGSHEIELEHGTARANVALIEAWRETRHALLLDTLAYVHGINSCILFDLPRLFSLDEWPDDLVLVCIEDRVSTVDYTVCRIDTSDGFLRDHRGPIDTAHEIVFATEQDLPFGPD